MKTAEYRLAGEEAKARGLAGATIKTREAETDEEFLTLVQDGDAKHMRRLAQSALDIIVQRKIREVAESDWAQNTLAGKATEGDPTDYAAVDDAGRRQAVLDECQNEANTYTYGSVSRAPGAGKAAKKAIETTNKLAAAAAADPKLAKRLADLGIELPS